MSSIYSIRNDQPFPKINFLCGWSERDAYDAEARGYLSHVEILIDESRKYQVVFYDPVRLAQDLEEEAKLGKPYIAEKRMLIVPVINLENIKFTVDQIVSEGYFDEN